MYSTIIEKNLTQVNSQSHQVIPLCQYIVSLEYPRRPVNFLFYGIPYLPILCSLQIPFI